MEQNRGLPDNLNQSLAPLHIMSEFPKNAVEVLDLTKSKLSSPEKSLETTGIGYDEVAEITLPTKGYSQQESDDSTIVVYDDARGGYLAGTRSALQRIRNGQTKISGEDADPDIKSIKMGQTVTIGSHEWMPTGVQDGSISPIQAELINKPGGGLSLASLGDKPIRVTYGEGEYRVDENLAQSYVSLGIGEIASFLDKQ